ncbi:ABC transporter ATP-binding protein [Telmatospirillum siberiense]|uniref:Glutathione import ATP-binding protein GsiA n=1 Tax=Telmatospirillum siberiense TaxID=382514 RepID=A0A2N3PYM8_9PROT|nr:oligopeptide/dipeptide ABC transporter ATP-binding protein [Telmatospirillum siberiense]PKU25514.1 dipeptide/oligopeptide/nickel ABC transporter ATP-binding protein [Telmatospirillum siberiense]
MSNDLPLPSAEDRGGPAQPILIVNGLRKHFPLGGGLFGGNKGAVHAVDGVNITVPKRTTLGIVGESGCGKSTTARLLTRLIEPDEGEVIFDGEAVGVPGGMPLKELRRNLQLVFQDSFASLNPRMTIERAIAFGPQVHGLPASEAIERSRHLLDRVGLEPGRFGGRYPHELSGGQRQRVNIARALAFNPRLIILDESVSALDKSVQAQVLNLLMDLKDELKLTYMFISHDLNVVQYISDHVMVMYLGQVVEVGPVEEVYAHPRHPYTKALLSAVPSLDPARRTERTPLTGDPPNPINPPPGCRFRDRCPKAHAVCAEIAPPSVAVGADHRVACLMADPASGHPDAS